MEKTKLIGYSLGTVLALAVLTIPLGIMEQNNELWEYCQENFGANAMTFKPSLELLPNTCVYENEEGKLVYVELTYIKDKGWKQNA